MPDMRETLKYTFTVEGETEQWYQLGFSTIYIQAKQWQLDSSVGRPEIQRFAGALQGERASKGLFITTAKFSEGAKQYANNLHGSNIVLIDGNALQD